MANEGWKFGSRAGIFFDGERRGGGVEFATEKLATMTERARIFPICGCDRARGVGAICSECGKDVGTGFRVANSVGGAEMIVGG